MQKSRLLDDRDLNVRADLINSLRNEVARLGRGLDTLPTDPTRRQAQVRNSLTALHGIEDQLNDEIRFVGQQETRRSTASSRSCSARPSTPTPSSAWRPTSRT